MLRAVARRAPRLLAAAVKPKPMRFGGQSSNANWWSQLKEPLAAAPTIVPPPPVYNPWELPLDLPDLPVADYSLDFEAHLGARTSTHCDFNILSQALKLIETCLFSTLASNRLGARD